MIGLQGELLVILLSVSLLCAIALSGGRAQRKAHRRTEQLKEAAAALETHYAALEQFLDDPAAPADLKNVLVRFSDTISDQKEAVELAAYACDPSPAPANAAPELKEQLRALQVHRPDLSDAFARAMGSGIVALFLRWPETTREFEGLVRRVMGDPDREVAFAATAARFHSRDNPPSINGKNALAT